MNWLKVVSLASLFLLLVPVAVLLYYGLGPLRSPAGYSATVLRSIGLTLVSSAVAAIVDVVLFTPLAYYLARGRDRLAETLVDVPVSIPHPIVGVALAHTGQPARTPTGMFLTSLGIDFYNTILGLVVALVIMSAPIYVKAMQPYFESKDAAPEDFAMGMGASRFRTMLSVVIPSSVPGIEGASFIAMSRALSEFGSISIIAYYVLQYPFYGVSPASVTIYALFSGAVPGGLDAAVTASAVMILVSLPIALAAHFVREEVAPSGPTGGRATGSSGRRRAEGSCTRASSGGPSRWRKGRRGRSDPASSQPCITVYTEPPSLGARVPSSRQRTPNRR